MKIDRELVECNARLADCKLKLAEHNRMLPDYEKSNKLTLSLRDTVAAELLIFFIWFLLVLGLL